MYMVQEEFEAMPVAWHRRRVRLRAVFRVRKINLERCRHLMHWQHNYGDLVYKYCRARDAWRRFRGWE